MKSTPTTKKKTCEVCGKEIKSVHNMYNKRWDAQLEEWIYVHGRHCADVWEDVKTVQDDTN